jgi:acetoin utilization protein AcuB
VVDGTRLVGLVSHNDMLRAAVSELLPNVPYAQTRERNLEENTFVVRVMTRNPVTATSQTPIAEAAALMLNAGVGCLPIVEDDQLVGIVTETDFLALLVRLLGDKNTPV